MYIVHGRFTYFIMSVLQPTFAWGLCGVVGPQPRIVQGVSETPLGRATCLFMHVKQTEVFCAAHTPPKMLRTLPAAVGVHVPRCTRKGAIPARHARHAQPLPDCMSSWRCRQLRLQMISAVPNNDVALGTTVVPADEPALCSIRSALQDGMRPVACQGMVQLSSPVAIYGQDQTGQNFAVQLPPTDAAALQSLLDAAVLAAGGNDASSEVRRRIACKWPPDMHLVRTAFHDFTLCQNSDTSELSLSRANPPG